MTLPIAILGAGIAGIAAARALCQRGLPVQLYDKGRSSGGRVATRRSPPWQFDHGAQFFTVRSAEFAAALPTATANGAIAEWPGPFVTLDRGQRGPDPRPGQRRLVGVPGMSNLPRSLAEGLEVTASCRVVRLRHRGGCWWLDCTSAAPQAAATTTAGPFQALLLALPPAQAATLLQASGIQSPITSAAAALAAALQPCLALLVALAAPVADSAAAWFVRDEVLGFAAHDGSKPGRGAAPTYVLHGTARFSAQEFAAEPAAPTAALLQAFASALGQELPPVVHSEVHRWRYALAANEQLGASLPAAGCILDTAQRLVLAGDTLVGGRVEGAFCSGYAAGKALAEALIQ